MKFLVTLVAMALASQAAMAEKIYCSFTEPFISITYDSDTNKAFYSTPDKPDVPVDVKVTFNKGGTILLMTLDNKYSLLVDTTKEGSDGMSDFIYPFEGILNSSLYGGCETDHLKKKLSSAHGYCAQ
ncbi:MAG: hypothetical protein J7501_02930 [Bdellovibrio sp.]|nr:hypothetical protein [Bdellovibrio sp.]